jgi:hypothetical protein
MEKNQRSKISCHCPFKRGAGEWVCVKDLRQEEEIKEEMDGKKAKTVKCVQLEENIGKISTYYTCNI